MEISPQEAARQMRDVEHTTKLSKRLYGYHRTSPFLILWGLIWCAGYAATDVSPAMAGWVWLVLDCLGIAVTFVIARRMGKKDTAGDAASGRIAGLRTAGLCLIAVAGLYALYAVTGPLLGRQYLCVPVLLTGIIYMAVGLWQGLRMLLCGAVVFAAALGGYFYMAAHYGLLLGILGGGALILTGLWMRRV